MRVKAKAFLEGINVDTASYEAVSLFGSVSAIQDGYIRISDAVTLATHALLLRSGIPETNVHAIIKVLVNTGLFVDFGKDYEDQLDIDTVLMVTDSRYVMVKGWETVFNYHTLKWEPIPYGEDTMPITSFGVSLLALTNRMVRPYIDLN